MGDPTISICLHQARQPGKAISCKIELFHRKETLRYGEAARAIYPESVVPGC